MAILGEAWVNIGANTAPLAAGLTKAKTNVAASMKNIGKSMTIAGAVIVAGFGMAIRTAAQFEQSMANTASVAGATSEELKKLSDYARKMGEQSVFSASQAADAMYYLASAGMNTKEIMGALEGTLALAAATQSDLAYTSESVAASLSQYGLAAEDAERVSNVFAAAISDSQATMDKLTTSMSYVGPMAYSMGMDIEDTTGILMNLYNAGLDGSKAGTALRMAFVKLIEPTQDGTAALEKLGVAVKDSEGNMRPFKDIIDDLGVAGMSTADAMDIFGIRAGPAMMALVSQGTGAIQEATDAVTGTNKAFEMAAMQIDTFQGAIKLLRSAFEELQITLVQNLMPSVRGLIEWITEGIKKVTAWMKENPKLTETIVKVTAAVGALMLVLGPLLMILPGLVAGFHLLVPAIVAVKTVLLTLASGGIYSLVLAAVTSFVIAYKTNLFGMKTFTDKVILGMVVAWDWYIEKTNKLGASIGALFLSNDDLIKASNESIATFMKNTSKFGGSLATVDAEIDKLAIEANNLQLAISSIDWGTEDVMIATDKQKLYTSRLNEINERLGVLYLEREKLTKANEEAAQKANKLAEANKNLESFMEPVRKIIEGITVALTPYEQKIVAVNAKYDDMIETIQESGVAQEEITVAVENANIARDAELKKLAEGKTAYDKLIKVQKTAKDIMAGIVDKIFQFTHTPYEVKLRDIKKEYDGYIEGIKEAKLGIEEEKKEIDDINTARDLAIQHLNAEIDTTKGLSLEMQILTAEYKLSKQTAEDTIKYYQDMLEAAEKIVEVKKTERDTLEEGTTEYKEANLAYLEVRTSAEEYKEIIEKLNEIKNEELEGLELVNAKLEIQSKQYQVIAKDADYYKDRLKWLKEEHVTLAGTIADLKGKGDEWTTKLVEIRGELYDNETATKELKEELIEFAKGMSEAELEASGLIPTLEALGVSMEELEEPPDVGPWKGFLNSLKAEVGDFASVAGKFFKEIWDAFGTGLEDAITSLFTMKKTNAKILEEMASAEADYINTVADLQEELAKTIQDINDDMFKEKEDYYDDLTAIELDYNRKVSDGIEDLARENEDYDIEMRRLTEDRNAAMAIGDDERVEYYTRKMEDTTLIHARAVEDMEEKQAELAEDNKIKVDQMAEDHKLAMDAMIKKKDEEAEDAKTKIGEVKTDHEDLMDDMEGDMTTVSGIAKTFWDTLKTAGVDAIGAIISQLVKQAVLFLLAYGPVGWAILLGAGALGAIWANAKALGGEIEAIGKSLGGAVKGFAAGGSSTDTVPAMLTPGEYVISKPMVDFIKRTGEVTSGLVGAIKTGARTPTAFSVGGGAGSNDYRKSYSSTIKIEQGAIQIVTPKFNDSDAQNMFKMIERQAHVRGLRFATN